MLSVQKATRGSEAPEHTKEEAKVERMNWYFRQEGAGTLLLVAVDGVPQGAGSWPCTVVGAISPMEAPPPLEEEAAVSRLLTEVGVPSHLLGFAYLRTALHLVQSDAALRRAITRTLYPRIAQEHHTTPRSVERAIRHAIAAAWERGGERQYRRALGRLASCMGERPTNSEFIAQLSEKLRLTGQSACGAAAAVV